MVLNSDNLNTLVQVRPELPTRIVFHYLVPTGLIKCYFHFSREMCSILPWWVADRWSVYLLNAWCCYWNSIFVVNQSAKAAVNPTLTLTSMATECQATGECYKMPLDWLNRRCGAMVVCWKIINGEVNICVYKSRSWPAHVAEWSAQSAGMCSRA